ncbi:hypothetical protein LTR37_013060 [Vermiconidia calcicola]|uniref:Uncharacterized protein n=1 Tax=Vermiconidia calcicola TaxID=1690605 RepID=A0ACC3MXG7_9PEZI|nr:hypothetical protein LTR37_013060 [Vermiconidia calcicola]
MGAFFFRSALLLFLLAISDSLVGGAFIPWENCLRESTLNSNPQLLQWVPLFLDAKFDSSNNLSVTVYGNVTGQQVQGDYPPPNDPDWQNDNITFGKIADVGSANNYSTLLADFMVLTYEAYEAKATQFCPTVSNGSSCPLGPVWNGNASNPSDLHAFRIEHNFGSPYHFSTLAGTIRVISGDSSALDVACVGANITPYLGASIAGLVTWLPAVILILKAVATLVAAIWSPWGSSDIFRWSSNYGRDEDLLRLVTPGFGDCLQYIQFVTLMGSLTLQYPGFFQPALSQTAWSLLLFNQSFVSHGNGTQSLQDGIYVTDGVYGIATLRQLIGMDASMDVWACMAVFLAVIALALIVLCQLGFGVRWIYRMISNTSEEDLRQKNIPFTTGNMVRLLFNFFILPIVALSLFQLVISDLSPSVVVGMAAVLFVLLIVSAGWILRVIFTTKPRTILFDDMPTVLMYGPLYNTYSDSAAPFALVPVLITIMRGVAFGAVQPSGTAQIIILAICEVILILTLNGFRPFQGQTSMNAYHTFFAVVRLVTVLLSVAFVPKLAVTEASKGWIGYVILLLHACVLVFGFFLNSAQTLIEVAVRSAGLAGSGAQTGAIRGNILGWRMLKKRQGRAGQGDRGSMSSDAAILRHYDTEDGRARSMSASSQQLLGQCGGTPNARRTSGLDNLSSDGKGVGSPEAGGNGGFAFAAGQMPTGQGKPSLGVKTDGEAFYRPPRRRTMDALTPGAQSRSVADMELPYQDFPGKAAARDSEVSAFGRDSPLPAYIRDRADSNGADASGQTPDYAVREVDQYYRGPALSHNPTRKLKTGPADPTGPAASAQSWFQRFRLGVQPKKEAGKGFEVVRSSRMPPGVQRGEVAAEDVEMQISPPMNAEHYHDSPEAKHGELQVAAGAERSVSPLDYHEHRARPSKDSAVSAIAPAMHPESPMHPGMRAEYPARDRSLSSTSRTRPSHDYRGTERSMSATSQSRTRPSHESRSRSQVRHQESFEYENERPTRISEVPSLGPIQGVGGMDIPSRFGSQRSGNMDMGQEWLREVDNLNWSHPVSSVASRQPSNYSDRSHVQRTPAPNIPERSNYRPQSSEGPHWGPQGRSQSAQRDEVDCFEEPTGFLNFGNGEDDGSRPNSFFNSSHHRAADSIHRNSFGANAAMQASSAEFMGASPPEQSGFGRGR